MYDTLVKIGNSLIQHGPNNDRIYLMKLDEDDFPQIIDPLDHLVKQKGYTKIFAKIPEYVKDAFLAKGYTLEATIPQFYNGKITAFFMGKYFSDERKQALNHDEIHQVLEVAKTKFSKELQIIIPSGDFTYRRCRETDIQEIIELYKKVFTTYPFPIFDPLYLAETMKSNVAYFGVWHKERLVSLASAEMDKPSSNVEMTDFATHPDLRGRGLSPFLLYTMEDYTRGLGLKTAYTIARSVSYGMNITFAKLGYTYSGTLINNTQISGRLESMNVWYKPL